MVIELTPEQEQQLRRMAADENRDAQEFAQEALAQWLRQIHDLAHAIREGEKSAEREGWLTNDEVFARLNARLPKSA